MARRTHEQIVREYAKEYDRIRKQIERMAKRGYDVHGMKPERVSKKDIKAKDLEKLKRITNEKIYEKSKFAGESGTKRRKEERSERSKKSAETKRRRKTEEWIKEVEKANRQPEAPKPPAAPPTPPEKPPTPPGPEEPTDEEEAALERMLDIINQYKESVRKKMNSWVTNMIRRVGRKKFAGMIVDAYNDGFIVEWVPPSQQETYSQLVMFTINSYLPPDMPEEEKKESEDEWQDVLDEIEDDEDFLPFD